MNRFTLAILFGLISTGFAAPLKVTPGEAYRLSFEAEGVSGSTPWVVELRDAEGNLPYDGVLESNWQRITAEQSTYTQLFYAPPDAATLRLVVDTPGVTVRNLRLEPWKQKNLVLNGNFSEGNLSGWSERYLAELGEKEGRPVLQVRQNGYALTDYIPIVGGGVYTVRSEQGTPGVNLFAYDGSRRFLQTINRKAGAPIQVPENAAYLRMIYGTGHSHLPGWRQNEIFGAELLPKEVPSPTRSKDEKLGTWEIVLAPGCDPREEFAAREMRHWIRAITGKTAPLLAEASTGKARKIFIGRAWAGAFGDDLKALEGSDGYAVRTKEGNLYVFAAHPRGVLYGVHALLERNTDIIWPRPSREFEVFFTQRPEISFENADFRSRPMFPDRFISRGANTVGPEFFQGWQGRNGLNSPWMLHKGNNYLVWLRGAQLGYSGAYSFWLGKARKEDEKSFPLVDGKRDQSRWRQPCYSYPGTAEGIATRIDEALQTLPGREMEYIHATISDNWTVCSCPDCMAPIDLPGGERLEARSRDATKDPLFFSTRNFLMLNRVAELLKEKYPRQRISTHAYIFTAEPPKVPVAPSIEPEFAAYPTQNVRYSILSGKGRKISSYDEGIWKRRFEAWGKEKKGELGSFGYYNVEGFNALGDTVAEDFRALASFQALKVHTEGYPIDGEALSTWDMDGIEKWVIARLMWDPAQDPEALREEYIRRVYRGAEKEMAAFTKLIRDSWHQVPESVFINCHTPASEIFENLIVKTGIEEKARTLLASAENAVTDARARKMISRQRAYFDKLASKLGRIAVPLVPESTVEWGEPSSPQWEKGAVVDRFRKVNDWRSLGKAEAEHPSHVSLMRDEKYLYLRFFGKDVDIEKAIACAPEAERFEIRLRNGRNANFYFSVGPDGSAFSLPDQENGWKQIVTREDDAWLAVIAIPLRLLAVDAKDANVMMRLGRLYREGMANREESSPNGAGIFNDHASLWLNLQFQ